MDQHKFNFEKFDIHLETEWLGRSFIFLEEIDSTNKYSLNELDSSTPNGTLVIAEKQHKGRGRFDRIWYGAKYQNLTFSILLRPKTSEMKLLNLINLLSAVSIHISIDNLFQLNASLKWPNDMLINNKKLSGILIETKSSGEKISKLVLGIGINVNQTFFTGEFHIPPTSLRNELKIIVEREKLLAEILNNFENLYTLLPKNREYILDYWRSKCKMIGDQIGIKQGEITKYGIFDDIDENGFLLLRTKDSVERISYGDLIIT